MAMVQAVTFMEADWDGVERAMDRVESFASQTDADGGDARKVWEDQKNELRWDSAEVCELFGCL